MHSLDCEPVEEKKETQIVFPSKCLFIFKCILLLFSCFSTFRAMLKRVKTMVIGTCRKIVSTYFLFNVYCMFMFPLGVGTFFQLKNQMCYKNRCSENKQEKSHFLWWTKFTISLSVVLCMLYPIKRFCWPKLAFLDLSQLIKYLWCQTRI